MTLDAVLARIDAGPAAARGAVDGPAAHPVDFHRSGLQGAIAPRRRNGWRRICGGWDSRRHRGHAGHPMVVGHGAMAGGICCSMAITTCSPSIRWTFGRAIPSTPRFEETPKGKVIRARGSSDDKGQLMTFIERAGPGRRCMAPCPAS